MFTLRMQPSPRCADPTYPPIIHDQETHENVVGVRQFRKRFCEEESPTDSHPDRPLDGRCEASGMQLPDRHLAFGWPLGLG